MNICRAGDNGIVSIMKVVYKKKRIRQIGDFYKINIYENELYN